MPSYEKRGDKWTVRFRTTKAGQTSNMRLSGFKTKKEAELAYNKALLLSNETIRNDITVAELFEYFKEYKRQLVKESTYVTCEQVIRDYIIPYFGKTKITDITTQSVINWKTSIEKLTCQSRCKDKTKAEKKPLSFRSKEKMFTLFITLMNFAVDFYDLPFNPVSKVGNFKNNEQKKEMQFWTNTEFEQFIAVVDNIVYKSFFATLYLTGARKGEAMALKWSDIDLKNNVINITKTYTNKVIGGGYKLTTTKTKSSIRQVIIPQVLSELLADLKAHYSTAEGFNKDCFVFGLSRPLSTMELDRKKAHYCKLAGVKEIRFHDFRHSHASLLLNQEQNIMLVAQRLGHSDVSMTLNTYSHLFPNKQQELMNSLKVKL